MRTPGSKGLSPSRRRVGLEQSAILRGKLLYLSSRQLRQDGRSQVLQRSYCTWVPHAIAHYVKHRTLHTVRQQKAAPVRAFSSPCHPADEIFLDRSLFDANWCHKCAKRGKVICKPGSEA